MAFAPEQEDRAQEADAVAGAYHVPRLPDSRRALLCASLQLLRDELERVGGADRKSGGGGQADAQPAAAVAIPDEEPDEEPEYCNDDDNMDDSGGWTLRAAGLTRGGVRARRVRGGRVRGPDRGPCGHDGGGNARADGPGYRAAVGSGLS
jgi:hypothetical protein